MLKIMGYHQTIIHCKTQIIDSQKQNWHQHWQRALGWARRRLPSLQQATIDKAAKELKEAQTTSTTSLGLIGKDSTPPPFPSINSPSTKFETTPQDNLMDMPIIDSSKPGNHTTHHTQTKRNLFGPHQKSLPKIYHGEVQLDYFAGAKNHHGIHILKHKTPVSPNVRMVILSFGLNNWAQNNSSLVQQNVNDLVEMAQNSFSNAKIEWATLNWSPQLPLATQANLARINNSIYRIVTALETLPKTHFKTETGLIHWTATTGQRMWRHWMSYFDL